MSGEFGAAMAGIRAAMSGPDERMADLQAEMQASHQEKLDRWERDRPKREAAFRAMHAANLRRGRELGLAPGQPVSIAAAAWAEPPEPPAFVPHPALGGPAPAAGLSYGYRLGGHGFPRPGGYAHPAMYYPYDPDDGTEDDWRPG